MAADPVDDPTIRDEHELWRRVHELKLTFDVNTQTVRPSSDTFKTKQMSVVLGTEAREANRDIRQMLVDHPGKNFYSIRAVVPRKHSLIVYRDPIDEEPLHALVDGKFTGGIAKDMCRSAEPVLEVSPEVLQRIKARVSA